MQDRVRGNTNVPRARSLTLRYLKLVNPRGVVYPWFLRADGGLAIKATERKMEFNIASLDIHHILVVRKI